MHDIGDGGTGSVNRGCGKPGTLPCIVLHGIGDGGMGSINREYMYHSSGSRKCGRVPGLPRPRFIGPMAPYHIRDIPII